MNIRCSILLSILLFCPWPAMADPLTKQDIDGFNIKDLDHSKFDKRMKTFRIIKHQKWQKKHKDVVLKAIIKMLQSRDVMQKRTGVQGANLMEYNEPVIQKLVIANLEKITWHRSNQYIYLRQSLIEYLVRRLKQAQATERQCRKESIRDLKKLYRETPAKR